MTCNDIFQNGVIDVCKELSDVTLQDPTYASVVFRNDTAKILKAVHGFVRSFADATGIRIVNELLIEMRIHFSMQ